MHKHYILKIKTAALLALTAVIAGAIPLCLPSDLEAITLNELGERMSQLSSEEEALLEQIVASETQVQVNQEQLQALNQDLENFEIQLEDLYQKRKELKESLKLRQELLMERMVYTYKYGNDDVTKFILSAKSLNEVINNLYLFKNIMERDAELIQEYRYEREEFDRVSRKSEEKKIEVEQTRQRVLEEQQQLEQSIAHNQALLEQVKGERSEVATLLSEIKRRIAQVQPPGLNLVGEWDMVATAYYSGGGGPNGNGITAIGLRVKHGIVAVDPKVIPLGTRLYIPGYGEALAADTGGWVKGDRIDLGFESLEECYRFGRRKIKVYLVEN
ncbi:MAG: 3D domain-containing protein [Actinomycetota bacterium]|nr:3D domain-containing protein [Actinomycetota bacterium]